MYDNLITFTHKFSGVSLSSSPNLLIPIPRGATMGRVMDIAAMITTSMADGGATVSVGTANDAASMAVLEIPMALAGAFVNGRLVDRLFRGVWLNEDDPESVLRMSIGGDASAGAADITVTVGFDFVAAE